MARPHSSEAARDPRREFLSTGDASAVLEARTALVDSLVHRAWEAYLAPAFPSSLALLAVGGFGRRELFPHSDVDLLILSEGEPRSPQAREALSSFLRSLWDSGLRLSHSVRTPAECCEVHNQNIELNISLLDQRFLCGDAAIYERLAARLPRFFHGERHALIRHLSKLSRSRHAKYSDTIQHLEPNVKETPGGLRDFQLVRWLSQLRGAQPDRLIAAAPLADLGPAFEFLARLRCWLHYEAGRDQNVLHFDAQEELAEQPFAKARDAASLMRAYFRHAREIHWTGSRWLDECEAAGSSLFAHFSDWRGRLSNAEFTVARERVYFKTPQALDQDPELALRLFTFVARHGIRPSVDCEKRLVMHLPAMAAYFSSPRRLWPALEELFSLSHAVLALRSMSESGFLRTLFPEWAELECLVVRDFYHRYTVDEHTLVAIQELTGLRGTKDAPRRRFAQLLEEIEQPGLLLFALLFHDAGKAARTGMHISESVLLAEAAMERIQMPVPQRETVRFLIDRHLDLSGIMNSRDLDEPATAEFLAHRAGTLERLKYLTLLTYADISAVNPTAMTPWRQDQLWRAYLVTYFELTRELNTERITAPAAVPPDMAQFLEGFPTRYLRTRQPQRIEADFRLHQQAQGHGVAVEIHRDNGVYSLTVVAEDRPFLLASITGAVSGYGMNILKAEAFSNRRGEVLDTFVFADTHRTLELNPSEMDRFRLALERAVTGRLDVTSLLKSRPAPPAPGRRARLRPSVFFSNEASASSTLIEVVAEDRPGLLHDLARTISSAGCNIEVVLIDTEAHKALDVFYVTAEGKKLTPQLEASLRQGLLAVCQG